MKNRAWLLWVVLAFGFLMTGCAHQRPLVYHDDNQIPQGSGLLSGKDGTFSLQFNHLGLDGTNNSPSDETNPNNGTKFSF